jgi:hypothetical protein
MKEKVYDDSIAIPVIGIPVLNRGDLLLRNVMSIDYPLRTLYIVNNGRDESVADAIAVIKKGKNPFIDNVIVYESPENLGVAPSWNHIIMQNLHSPYWLVVGNDVFFGQGDLKKIYEYVEKNKSTHAILFGHAYSCFVLTKLGLDTVGYFDENIFPAYLEDCDHFYRVTLAGAISENIPNTNVKHGEAPLWGSSTIHSDKKYGKANGITHGMNFEYYNRKWGGDNGQEKFNNPFNNPNNGIDYWELETERREAQKQVWK